MGGLRTESLMNEIWANFAAIVGETGGGGGLRDEIWTGFAAVVGKRGGGLRDEIWTLLAVRE